MTFSGHVLLVEDNIINQEMIVEMLQQFGCQVDTTANGRQALEALGTTEYDLILMDCQMPVMDGFTAVRAIREREETAGLEPTRIIALTANAMEGDRQRCLNAWSPSARAGRNCSCWKRVLRRDCQFAPPCTSVVSYIDCIFQRAVKGFSRK